MISLANVTFSPFGGAGVVASTLSDAYKQTGRVRVTDLFGTKNGRLNPKNLPFLLGTAADRYLLRDSGSRSAGIFTFYRANSGGIDLKANDFDVIHLHWPLGVIGTNKLAQVVGGGQAQIIITLHDMYFLTGGCHHSLSCRGYETDCGACPMVKPQFQEQIKKRKDSQNQFVQNENVHLVAPSKWVQKRAQIAFPDKQIHLIPNPIDSSIGTNVTNRPPQHKSTKNLVFVTSILEDPYKQLDEAVRILRLLNSESSVQRWSLNVVYRKGKPELTGENIRYTKVENRVKVLEELGKADFNLSTSSAETFSLTAAEAAFEGVPTVALGGTAIEDFVERGFAMTFSSVEEIVGFLRHEAASHFPDCDEYDLSGLRKDESADSYLRLIYEIANRS